MKTRTELWKNYRTEIDKNIQLKKAVILSNEKLKVLSGRLLKVFPTYESKYQSKLLSMKVSLEEIDSAPEYKTYELKQLISTIKEVENEDGGSLASIDETEFSSKELDDVIASIRAGKVKTMKYARQSDSKEIKLEATKVVKLGKAMKKINIAIDGPSGSGKSSAAKAVAKHFNLIYINTGLVYRAIALNCLVKKINLDDSKAVIGTLKEGMIKLLENEVVYFGEKDITKHVRADIVSQSASRISTIPEVREFATNMLQTYISKKGVVMDGRDTTFVVMPNAELKVFLDTKPEVRAKRRVEQNKKLGFDTNYDLILKEIKQRDHRDRTRDKDPLHQTEDAVLIDSSEMTLEDVVQEMISLANQRMR